jgi:Tol biopolymer transport system component
VIKCGVCGSENEAAALFCGTCGSPLSPAEGKAIAEEAAKTAPAETPTGDDAVVPGKGGARRDLGTGGGDPGSDLTGTQVTPVPVEPVTDSETAPGGPTITCGVCGTVNDASRTYCRKCANELKPAPPPPLPPPPPTPGRRISPVALGLGAAVVVVAIALIGVLLFGGGATPVATNAPSSQPSSPVGPTTGPGVTSEPSVLPTATAPAFTESGLTGQIAFARCPAGGGTCFIAIRPADSSAKTRRLTAATGKSAFDPALSPDGKHVMYTVEPGIRDLTIATKNWVSHSKGSGDVNVFWSPDGKKVTFSGHRDSDPGSADSDLEIRVDGATSGASTPLTKNDIVDHDPVFTPDGKSIVWVQGEDDERELRMIDIASGDVTDLTTDSFADEDPAVSPLGGQLVFSSKRGSGSEYDLFLLDLATLEISALPTMPGNEHDPAWSPGGRFIVFSGGAEGSQDLFILDLADSSITPFTTGGDADLAPTWSIGKG